MSVARDTVRLTAVGDTSRIIPIPRDRNGFAAAGASFTYVSSNPAVATVAATGLITLVNAGSATISVTAGSLTASTTVIGGVGVEAGVAWLRVTPASITIAAGDTTQFVADLMGPFGSVTRVTPIWSSDVPARLSINSDGRAIAAAVGNSVVTATHEGLAARAVVTISAAPMLSGFAFSPRVLTGIAGNALSFSVTAAAADAGAGIASVQVTFTAPGGATRSCTAMRPTWGSASNGGWDCTITIPAGSPSGTWHATAVTMTGTITRTYGESALGRFGGTTLEVRP
jgi:hypothetical protein